MKRKLASFAISTAICLSSFTQVNASVVPLTDGIGTGSTPTSFDVTTAMLDGGDLVITIPDVMTLGYDSASEKFTDASTVNVKGNISPAKTVEISTNTNITFKNQSDESITVPATVTFGESGLSKTTAVELHDAGASGKNIDISCEVLKSVIQYIGDYKSSILFNIEVTDGDITSYYMGYSLSDGSDLNYTNDDTIDYSTYAQTDNVYVLKEFSTDRNVLVSKGYDKIIESDASDLVIPTQIDGNDVVGVELDSLFKNNGLARKITNIEIPSSVTGIELTESLSSQATTVVTSCGKRANVNLSKKKPTQSELWFKGDVPSRLNDCICISKNGSLIPAFKHVIDGTKVTIGNGNYYKVGGNAFVNRRGTAWFDGLTEIIFEDGLYKITAAGNDWMIDTGDITISKITLPRSLQIIEDNVSWLSYMPITDVTYEGPKQSFVNKGFKSAFKSGTVVHCTDGDIII